MLSELKAAEAAAPEVAENTAPTPAETTAAPAETAEAEAKKHTLVSHAALHEERMTRKALQEEVRALREQQAQRDHEWRIGQERLAKALETVQQRNTPPPPDREADPLGYTVHAVDELRQQQAEAQRQAQERAAWEQQQSQKTAHEQRQEQQVRALHHMTNQSVAILRQSKPDTDAAISFVEAARIKQWQALGCDLATAKERTLAEAWQIAHENLMQQRSPAEALYALAETMGYVAATSEGAKLDMQKAGMAASKPSGGGTGKGRLTAAVLAQMSPSELAKVSDAEFQAAMSR